MSTELNWWSVACPHCAEERFRTCRTKFGKPTRTHAARRIQASLVEMEIAVGTDQHHIVRKLIVELNQRTDDDLTRAAEAGQMTKTTVVNRAVQVYERVRANQAAGGHLVLVKADGSTETLLFT